MKTLDLARWRVGRVVQLVFAARSFLHRQVRSMTGTLTEVGAGRWTADDVRRALEAADRTPARPWRRRRAVPDRGALLSNPRRLPKNPVILGRSGAQRSGDRGPS